MRTQLPEDAELSDPEHGDEKYQTQIELTDRDLLLEHKGTLPKDKKEEDGKQASNFNRNNSINH